jgi:NADP-dependent 3-hydroxy acid dehydrogenase YdfG
MNHFLDDVVVIAGADSELRRETLRAFVRRGARVMAGPSGATTNGAWAEQVASEALERFGRIDIWVNCPAGGNGSPIEEMCVDEIDHVIHRDLQRQLSGIAAALPIMRRQNRGTLICSSSVLCAATVPLQSSYCAVNYGIKQIAGSLQSVLKREGGAVRVVLVEPASWSATVPHEALPSFVGALIRAAEDPKNRVTFDVIPDGGWKRWSRRLFRWLRTERRRWQEPRSHLCHAVHGPAVAADPLIESASAQHPHPQLLDCLPVTQLVEKAATLLALSVLHRHTQPPHWCQRRRYAPRG